MGRIELAQRDIGLITQGAQRRQCPLAIPDMKEADPALARKQPGHPRLAGKPGQLIVGRRTGSVVTDGHLPHPQYLGDQDDVRLHRAGQGLDRQMVGAGIHKGAHPGGAKLAHLAEHLRRSAGQAVGAKRRHQGGDTGHKRLARRQLRGAKGKAPLTAAAGNMGQRIHQPGHQIAASTIDPMQRPVCGYRQPLAHPGDTAIGHQQILLAKVGRAEDLGPLDQGQHGDPPCTIVACPMKREGASSLPRQPPYISYLKYFWLIC